MRAWTVESCTTRALLALAVALIVSGCNLILGNEVGKLKPSQVSDQVDGGVVSQDAAAGIELGADAAVQSNTRDGGGLGLDAGAIHMPANGDASTQAQKDAGGGGVRDSGGLMQADAGARDSGAFDSGPSVGSCTSRPCQHGSCEDVTGGYTCHCDLGYTGNQCETDLCLPNPCNHGGCTRQDHAYTCDCDLGFAGANCETNLCAPNPCKNAATCIGGHGGYSCQCVGGWGGTNCTVKFDGVGFMSGFTQDSHAEGVSGDGAIVVGYARATTTTMGFKWTLATGMLPVESSGCGVARAITPDGSLIAGEYSLDCSGTKAAEFLGGTSWRNYDALSMTGDSTGDALSSDGTIVVGTAASGDAPHAVRWVGTNVSPQLLPSTTFEESYATGVSGDGAIIVGYTYNPSEAFRWTIGTGLVMLPVLGSDTSAQAHGVSGDGLVIVGSSGATAVRWLSGESLPRTLGGAGQAAAVSADGSVIVGAGGGAAFVWDAVHGMRLVSAVMTDVDLTGWTLTTATAVSADGKTVVGEGMHNSTTEGWVAHLP